MEDDPGKDLERETDRLDERGQAIGREIDDARADWERKRADPAVPGASPAERPPAPEHPTHSDLEADR